MDRDIALRNAIELTKLAIQSTEFKSVPDNDYADCIADFIETLANRLEKIGE